MMADDQYSHLGDYSDWVEFAHRQRATSPPSRPVELTPHTYATFWVLPTTALRRPRASTVPGSARG